MLTLYKYKLYANPQCLMANHSIKFIKVSYESKIIIRHWTIAYKIYL